MRGTIESLLLAYATVLCSAGTPFSNVVTTPSNNRTNIFKARVKQVGSSGMLGELGGLVENKSLAGIQELSVSIQNGMLSNLQVFGEGLGGLKAPDIVQSKDKGKPFAVNGEDFADFSSAATQSCKIQFTACSEKAKQSGDNSGKASAASVPKDKPADKPSAKAPEKPGKKPNQPADKPGDKPATGSMRMGNGKNGNGQKEGKTPPKPGGQPGNSRRAVLNGTSVDGSPHGALTSAESNAVLGQEANVESPKAPDAPPAQPASSGASAPPPADAPSAPGSPGPAPAPAQPGEGSPAPAPPAVAPPASPPQLPPQLPPPPPGPEAPAPASPPPAPSPPNRVQDTPANKAAGGDVPTADACQQQQNRCNAALKSAPFQSFTLDNVGPDPSMPDFDLLCGGPA